MSNETNKARIAKTDVKFSTPLEKTVHKEISSMRYFENRVFDLEMSNGDIPALKKAITKSVRYNCMSVRITWINDKTALKVTTDDC